MLCNNCGTNISCKCQIVVASDGKRICTKCVASYEAALKKKKING